MTHRGHMTTEIEFTYKKNNPKDKRVKVQLVNKGPNGNLSSIEDEKVIEHGESCSFFIHDRNIVRVEEIVEEQ
jgi:hypothetical protein